MSIKEFYKENKRVIQGSFTVLFFVGCWQAVGQSGMIDPMFTSYPSLIFTEFYNMFFVTGEIWPHMAVSGKEVAIGLGSAIIVGIVFGILMGRYALIGDILDPFVNVKMATPTIALLPLFIIWLGIGLASKVLLIFLTCLINVLINTYEGVKRTDPRLIEAARAYGAKERDIFFKVILNSATPFIIAGLRLSVAHATIAVMVSEMYAATAGLGFLISITGVTFQTAKLFVVIIVFASWGIISSALIRRLERWWAPYMHELYVT